MNELILTDEQKRFWSQENWKNLRVYDSATVDCVWIMQTEVEPNYPIHIKYYYEKVNQTCGAYCDLDGKGRSGLDGIIVTEVKPKQMVPWGKKEFAKHRNCLFRVPDRVKFEGKEVWFNGYNEIFDDGIKWDERCDLYPFDEFCNDGVEYSPDDGTTWLPCAKEVPNE